MGRTCIFVHAHPDDEALLTAGTMARLAAEGWRVVLVVATAGEHGLTSGGPGPVELATIRTAELRASAAALRVARTHMLGFGDSGLDGRAAARRPGDPPPFAQTDVVEAAERLAALLVEEDADVVTGYDAAGGYGHPDHVRLHHVVSHAAWLARTPTFVEATVDRDALLRALRLLATLRLAPPGCDIAAFEKAFTPASEITDRVDVRRFAAAKRASMAAHASQASGGTGVRTLSALLRLPRPLFGRVLGTEWFVRRSATPYRDPTQ